MPNPVDDVEMFAAFDSMNITYYRIDTTKPLEEQKPVDAILHKVMYCFLRFIMNSDQFEVKGEESERIKRWLDETRRNYPNMVFIDSLDYLHEFLSRSYTYEVGEEAIRKSHLESFLSVPAYFLLPKGENLGQALHSHRCYEME